MFHDEDQFFSHNNTNKIWAHNTVGKSCSYYGQIYPHIIDFISNKAPVTTQVFKSLYFHSDVQEYFSSTRASRIVDNETYQKIVLYNTDQTSGLRNIIRKGNDNPFVSVTSAPEDVIIEKSEGV